MREDGAYSPLPKAQWRCPPIALRPQALGPGHTSDEEECPHGLESHHQHHNGFGAPGAGHARQPPAATNGRQLSPPAKRAAGLIGNKEYGDKRQRCVAPIATNAAGVDGQAEAGGVTVALGGEAGCKANGLQTGGAAGAAAAWLPVRGGVALGAAPNGAGAAAGAVGASGGGVG